MHLEIGNVVKSLQGKDKQNYFCVVGIEEPYVMLSDGKIRKLENPKRKKIKHLQKTSFHLRTEVMQVNKHLYRAIKCLNIEEE